MNTSSIYFRRTPACTLAVGLIACVLTPRAPADVVMVESRSGGQNYAAYSESGAWANSTAKSTAPGTTTGIGSRYGTQDGISFSVTPTLANAGGRYIVEATHGVSTSFPTNLLASVTVIGGSGLPTQTTAFARFPENAWREVGTLTLDPGVTTPTVTFTKLPVAGTAQRIGADAVRFTWADDPGLQTPQIPTVNGPLAAGQTYVDVPTVQSNATAVVVYADGAEIGRRTSGIDGDVERVTTSPLVKGQVIAATQIGTNGIESLRLDTGGVVGGGANPRVRISLSIRQNIVLTGPIGANGGTQVVATNVFLGATNTFGGGWGLAPVGGKVLHPATCWQTVTFERGANPSNSVDPVYSWAGTTGGRVLEGNFGVLDAIAFAIDDLSDTGPFRVYIDEVRNGGVLVQGFESATNGEQEVLFRHPGGSGSSTDPYLLAQAPGSFSPNVAQVTDAFSDEGDRSMLVQWQFIDRAGGNWLRLVARGSGTPNPELDLRLPITFRMMLLPAGVTNPPLQVCTQPVDAAGLQGQAVTLEVRGTGIKPIVYQWYCDGAVLAGQTNRTLTIANARMSDSGTYRAVVTDATGSITSSPARVTVEAVVSTGVTEPLWSLAPGDRPYLAPDGEQSGLAFNPATGNLILVTRSGGAAVVLLDGQTGAEAGRLGLDSGTVNGGYRLVSKVAALGNGSVFVCNLTTNASLDPFKVYYWPQETPDADPAGIVWQGDPGGGDGGRWGDTMAVREVDVGGTPYQEILVSEANENNLIVLRPGRSDLFFTLGDLPEGAMNHGLAWGADDTVWAKSRLGDLYHIGLDIPNGTAAVLHTYTNHPTLGPLGVDPTNGLLGAVSVAAPDALRLYGLTDLAKGPILWDSQSFGVDQPWSEAAGAVTFGQDRVYGLSPSHGIVAMQLYLPLFMEIRRTNNVAWLDWAGTGILQSAPTAAGPYTDVPGAGTNSPGTVNISADPQRYFRIRK